MVVLELVKLISSYELGDKFAHIKRKSEVKQDARQYFDDLYQDCLNIVNKSSE